MEVTKWTEALQVKKSRLRWLSERTGYNASECRTGLENVNAEADQPRSRQGHQRRGKPAGITIFIRKG